MFHNCADDESIVVISRCCTEYASKVDGWVLFKNTGWCTARLSRRKVDSDVNTGATRVVLGPPRVTVGLPLPSVLSKNNRSSACCGGLGRLRGWVTVLCAPGARVRVQCAERETESAVTKLQSLTVLSPLRVRVWGPVRDRADCCEPSLIWRCADRLFAVEITIGWHLYCTRTAARCSVNSKASLKTALVTREHAVLARYSRKIETPRTRPSARSSTCMP